MDKSNYILPNDTQLKSNKYTIKDLLGKPGGFGITYKAWDSKEKKNVAIKELFTDLGNQYRCKREDDGITVKPLYDIQKYQKDKNNFVTEYKMISSFMGETDIVQIYDFFEENNTCYLVMELIEGWTLKEYINDKKGLSNDEAISIIIDILKATQKIHKKEILHRDLKPVNVLITPERKIVIIDFGVAREEEDEYKRNHTQIKSKGYSAPELEVSNKICGKFTDVYSIGGILYTMLVNDYPPDATQLVSNHTMAYPKNRNQRVSDRLNHVVHKAMSPKIAERYQNCEEMLYDLRTKSNKNKIIPKKNESVLTYFLGSLFFVGILSIFIWFFINRTPKTEPQIETPNSLKIANINMVYPTQNKTNTPITNAQITDNTKQHITKEITDNLKPDCFSSKGKKKIRFYGQVTTAGILLFRGSPAKFKNEDCKRKLESILQKPMKYEPAKDNQQKPILQEVEINIELELN